MRNAAPWKDLICGQQRLWVNPSTPHWNQYQRWFGSRKHVGIELEFSYYTWDDNLIDHFVSKINDLYTRSPRNHGEAYTVRKSHSREIQVLWDVEDPIDWVNDMWSFTSALSKLAIPTTGSVHVNIQSIASKCVYGRDQRLEADPKTRNGLEIYRQENKCGPSWLSPEEFICNMLVAVALYGDRTLNIKRATQLADILDPLVTPHLHICKPSEYLEHIHKWIRVKK